MPQLGLRKQEMENEVCTKVWRPEWCVGAPPPPIPGIITTDLDNYIGVILKRASGFLAGS